MLLELHAVLFKKPTHQNPKNLYLCQVQKVIALLKDSDLSLSLLSASLGFSAKILKVGQMRSHMPGSE